MEQTCKDILLYCLGGHKLLVLSCFETNFFLHLYRHSSGNFLCRTKPLSPVKWCLGNHIHGFFSSLHFPFRHEPPEWLTPSKSKRTQNFLSNYNVCSQISGRSTHPYSKSIAFAKYFIADCQEEGKKFQRTGTFRTCINWRQKQQILYQNQNGTRNFRTRAESQREMCPWRIRKSKIELPPKWEALSDAHWNLGRRPWQSLPRHADRACLQGLRSPWTCRSRPPRIWLCGSNPPLGISSRVSYVDGIRRQVLRHASKRGLEQQRWWGFRIQARKKR